MTESAAICQYLVSRYGPSPLNVMPEEPDYAAFLNGLHFGEATLTFPQTLVLREPSERRCRRSRRITNAGSSPVCAKALRLAKARAIAAPIPWPAPMTSAVRPRWV
jgi:glutathione S-transferase